MNKKNLIWIGLGVVALYLYFRNKPSAVTPKAKPPLLRQPIPAPPFTRNASRPRPKDLPVLMPDKGAATKYDCNWVFNELVEFDKMMQEIRNRPKEAKISIDIKSYSQEQHKAAKDCGLNLPTLEALKHLS